MLLYSTDVYHSEIPELDKMLVHNISAGYKLGMICGVFLGVIVTATAFSTVCFIKRRV